MNDEMIVAYVCDLRYKSILTKSMNSVKRYNKNVRFVVLSDKPYDIEDAEVYTFVPNYELFKFKKNDRMGSGVYYKLYLPRIPYDKILYMEKGRILETGTHDELIKKDGAYARLFRSQFEL